MEAVLVLGREMTDGLRRAGGTEARESFGGSEVSGLRREAVELSAEGRVRDNFFMFRKWGLPVVGKVNESVSEVAEERVDAGAEVSENTRVTSGFCAGVSMRRLGIGPLLRVG